MLAKRRINLRRYYLVAWHRLYGTAWIPRSV